MDRLAGGVVFEEDVAEIEISVNDSGIVEAPQCSGDACSRACHRFRVRSPFEPRKAIVGIPALYGREIRPPSWAPPPTYGKGRFWERDLVESEPGPKSELAEHPIRVEIAIGEEGAE